MHTEAHPCFNQNSQRNRNYLLQLLGLFTVPVFQSQVRLVHDTTIGWPSTRPLAIVDQTVDQSVPVAGTRMRQ